MIPAVSALVIEDDPTMARLLCQVLELEGFAPVHSARTAREAAATAEGAGVIFLDQQLPDETGLDLLPALLARPDPPIVVMVTGEDRPPERERALALGARAVLVKDATLTSRLPALIRDLRASRHSTP